MKVSGRGLRIKATEGKESQNKREIKRKKEGKQWKSVTPRRWKEGK